jgi:hypothetical protein
VNVAIIAVQRNISGFGVLLVDITLDEGRKAKIIYYKKRDSTARKDTVNILKSDGSQRFKS